MAGDRVLLPHPRTIYCHCLDPGKDSALHDLQIDVCVDPEASLKDVRAFLTFLEAIGALGARETTCLGSLVSVRAPS
jgi:hypothetical protein